MSNNGNKYLYLINTSPFNGGPVQLQLLFALQFSFGNLFLFLFLFTLLLLMLLLLLLLFTMLAILTEAVQTGNSSHYNKVYITITTQDNSSTSSTTTTSGSQRLQSTLQSLQCSRATIFSNIRFICKCFHTSRLNRLHYTLIIIPWQLHFSSNSNIKTLQIFIGMSLINFATPILILMLNGKEVQREREKERGWEKEIDNGNLLK